MSETEKPDGAAAPSPGYAAGIFFLLWAALGWRGVLSNAPLMKTLGAPGLDPGPAMLPLMTCSALTAGGLWLVFRGLLARDPGVEGIRLGHLATPALFLSSALAAGLLIGALGFDLPAFAFIACWLAALGGRGSPLWRRCAVSLALAAVVVAGIHLIFVQLLRAPLP